MSEATLNSLLDSIETLLSKNGVALRETSEELGIAVHSPSLRDLADEIRTTLGILWSVSFRSKGLFQLAIVMTREKTQEVLHVYEDCSTDAGADVFDEAWDECPECSNFLSSLAELYSTHDSASAARTLVDFISHLSHCAVRQTHVQLEAIVSKRTICQLAMKEAGEPQFVFPSFWYDIEAFYVWLNGMSPWDFFRRYTQKLDSAYIIITKRPKGVAVAERGAFIIVPVDNISVLSDRMRTTNRVENLQNIVRERDGMAAELVLRNSPLVPPSILLLNVQDYGPEDKFLKALCGIVAYSMFCVVSDEVESSGDLFEFSKILPYERRAVKIALSTNDNDLLIQIRGKPDHRISKNEFLRKAIEIHAVFCEFMGHDAYSVLRKTAASELLKLKFATIVDLVLETNSLLTYYSTLKNQLLEKRIDQLAVVTERMSDSAVKSSLSLSEMLESMQHDAANVSLVILGGLLAQGYSYVSKLLEASQLVPLLILFGILCSLLLLLVDFRLSDVEDTGRFVREAFASLETTVSQQTGLRVSTWGDLVDNCYRSLLKRVQILDTLTWGALVGDFALTYYLLFMLKYYGYDWWVAVVLGAATAVLFVTVFAVIRSTKSGVSRIRGRSTGGTLLVLIALLVVVIGTSLLVIWSWPEIAAKMEA